MGEPIYIHPAEARRRFREFAESDFGADQLAEGALLIALEEYPRLDPEYYLSELARLADDVERRCAPTDPDIFRLGHLHAVLFDIEGYQGNSGDYYDTRNAYLNEVMERKAGLPILLSILFLDVARRIGLEAVGVGLPGHYIVKVKFELNELYVDPFRGGATLTMDEIAALLAGVTGGRIRLGREHLRGWSERETLLRVLANLENMYIQAGDARRAAAARERMGILARV